jgi:hypothetical protein
MMDPRDMPTAGDYAWSEARNARAIAEGSAKKDAASREELEAQVFVLRGQVAFLADHVVDLLTRTGAYVPPEDKKTLRQIGENAW